MVPVATKATEMNTANRIAFPRDIRFSPLGLHFSYTTWRVAYLTRVTRDPVDVYYTAGFILEVTVESLHLQC